MKATQKILSALLASIFLFACEDEIFPELEPAEPLLVIDAWINNKPETQVIRLTETQGYYNSNTPPAVENASVAVVDENGKQYVFAYSGQNGEYTWTPNATDSVFGQIGLTYQLTIGYGEEIYEAQSTMNRVPEIDSVTFEFESGDSFLPEGYLAEFFARDFVGVGDTYWIKTFKNGVLLNKPNEINIAFDGGFSAGGNVDGIYFIQPIRNATNPFDVDENDELLPSYLPGDSVYIEIYSITNEAFIFLNEMRIQTDRPGGFAELFATPLSNVPTNIAYSETAVPAVGYFNVSAVSANGKFLDPDNLPQ